MDKVKKDSKKNLPRTSMISPKVNEKKVRHGDDDINYSNTLCNRILRNKDPIRWNRSNTEGKEERERGKERLIDLENLESYLIKN